MTFDRFTKKKKKSSGSETLRKIVRVKLDQRTAAKVQRALKRIGIPSTIRKSGARGRTLDLTPRTSARKIIAKNRKLRRITRFKK